MNDAALMSEIETMVQGGINAGEVVAAAWITHGVMMNHSEAEGRDADWLTGNARRHVRACVQKVLGRYKASESVEGDPQLALPGFSRLQKAYLIERNGEQVIVPIDQMTPDELLERAAEYERMAAGCQEHAREIKRYVADSAAVSAAAG